MLAEDREPAVDEVDQLRLLRFGLRPEREREAPGVTAGSLHAEVDHPLVESADRPVERAEQRPDVC